MAGTAATSGVAHLMQIYFYSPGEYFLPVLDVAGNQ
jgi:hypothetical protein